MTTFQITMFCIGVTVSLAVLISIISILLILVGEYIKNIIDGLKWWGHKMTELRDENKDLKSKIKELESFNNYQDHVEHGDDPNPGKVY